ncbi:MAG: alanine racemase, partial [Bacillota bacterium]|nr:alanine racemase [Bacillota bacterium]
MELSHVQTPALILDLDVFEENARIMQDYVSGTKMALRPHYKSHKCTAIAHRQIAAGAKGICCAKVSEAEDLANAGIEDILIANQVADPAKITRVATLAAGCYVTVAVDNAQNIADLETAAAFQQATIHCLVEYEIGMN